MVGSEGDQLQSPSVWVRGLSQSEGFTFVLFFLLFFFVSFLFICIYSSTVG